MNIPQFKCRHKQAVKLNYSECMHDVLPAKSNSHDFDNLRGCMVYQMKMQGKPNFGTIVLSELDDYS